MGFVELLTDFSDKETQVFATHRYQMRRKAEAKIASGNLQGEEFAITGVGLEADHRTEEFFTDLVYDDRGIASVSGKRLIHDQNVVGCRESTKGNICRQIMPEVDLVYPESSHHVLDVREQHSISRKDQNMFSHGRPPVIRIVSFLKRNVNGC